MNLHTAVPPGKPSSPRHRCMRAKGVQMGFDLHGNVKGDECDLGVGREDISLTLQKGVH